MLRCHSNSANSILPLFRFDLYFRHVQPLYPLFSRQQVIHATNVSDRLKMAMFAVASRFAHPDSSSASLISPSRFAKRARSLASTDQNSLCIDDLKTSLLLCVHDMAESCRWEVVAEVSKLARMAETYYASFLDAAPVDTESESDAEEWKSVWWTIYSLDTVCSGLT